jgi:two-component system sensor histidine kinase TctE
LARTEPRLQRKLQAWLLGPLLALLCVDTAVSYWTSLNFSNRAHDRSLLEIAREVVLHVHANGQGPRLEVSPAAARMLLVNQDDQVVYRLDAADGRMLGGDPSLAGPVPGNDLSPRFRDTELHGIPMRMVEAWMPYDGSSSPDDRVRVQVAETLNRRNRLAWEILASVVVPQLLLIVLAGVVVRVGVARGLQPLRRLQAAVSDRSHLDLSPIDVRDVPAEVKPLVEEVNELFVRLDKTLDFQNRFIADAAHQLKTPVSGLKAQIELALHESDPARVQHSLAQLYVSADRLSRLVRQLLSLARNEPGAAEAVHLQAIDLHALAMEAAMDWVPDALKRGIDLGFEAAQAPVTIDGDPDRLRELINNLIDNAIRYSRQDGRVTVVVGQTADGQARLSVSDDGPHIPVAERTRIFERFHRLLGTHTDGSGLGLAIVREIATLHQAGITLEEDSDGIGNTFNVHFPPSRQAASGTAS